MEQESFKIGTVVEILINRNDLGVEAGDFGIIAGLAPDLNLNKPVYIIKIGKHLIYLSHWNFKTRLNEIHKYKNEERDQTFCRQRLSDGKLCSLRAGNKIHLPSPLIQWLSN